MHVTDLTPDLFHRALRIYLGHAYDDGAPAAQSELADRDLASTDEVLTLFVRESQPGPEELPLERFVLRLGNDRYPHMKMALMQFVEPGEWVWSVDTHDRMPVQPGSAEWQRFQDLRVHNLKIKAAVEAGWRDAGLDTCRVVARRLPTVASDQAGPLVLVVDDEEGMRSAAVNVLRSEGYRVVEADSGLAGLERFVEEAPSLVLLDYDMPGMDGLALAHRLREVDRAQGGRTPILMATAGGADMSQERVLDGFMIKPYQRTLLVSFVKHQLPWDKRRSGTSGPTE